MKDWEIQYKLECIKDTIMEWLKGILIGIVAIFILGTVIIGIYCACMLFDYNFDKTNCNLYVDNKLVYTGRTALVHVDSIGENGNTKKVTVSKDKYGLYNDKVYISNNVRLETINE